MSARTPVKVRARTKSDALKQLAKPGQQAPVQFHTRLQQVVAATTRGEGKTTLPSLPRLAARRSVERTHQRGTN